MDIHNIVDEIFRETGFKKKDIKEIAEQIFSTIDEAIKKGEEVELPNRMGKFIIVERKSKKYKDMQTGEIREIKPRKAVKFVSYHYRNWFKGR